MDVVEGNVKEFLNIYETSENLKNFIKNPTQPQSNQLNVLNKISTQMNISKVTKNFLNVLVLKRKIFLNFLSLASKKRGELKASLISSKNMTIEEIENLNKDLSQTLGATIALDFKVDENLIGGLTMKIGSLMIDTSIKNKLKKYEKTMLEI